MEHYLKMMNRFSNRAGAAAAAVLVVVVTWRSYCPHVAHHACVLVSRHMLCCTTCEKGTLSVVLSAPSTQQHSTNCLMFLANC